MGKNYISHIRDENDALTESFQIRRPMFEFFQPRTYWRITLLSHHVTLYHVYLDADQASTAVLTLGTD